MVSFWGPNHSKCQAAVTPQNGTAVLKGSIVRSMDLYVGHWVRLSCCVSVVNCAGETGKTHATVRGSKGEKSEAPGLGKLCRLPKTEGWGEMEGQLDARSRGLCLHPSDIGHFLN